jgi:hypothetical protein
MNPRITLLSALIIGSAVPAASAAISLTDSFSGPTLTAGLEASAADTYTFSNGAVSNTGTSGRQYIRTVASNLRSQDFSMSLTYTIVDGYGDYGIAFFGLGSGAPDTGFHGEPLRAVYFRHLPVDFGDGNLNASINSGTGTVDELQPIGAAASGTHRVRLTKLSDLLTFDFDVDSSGGAFTSDYSQSIDLGLPAFSFLNDSNSRLFFGSQAAGVAFSEVSISAVPGPSSALGTLGLMAAGAFVRRRKVVA